MSGNGGNGVVGAAAASQQSKIGIPMPQVSAQDLAETEYSAEDAAEDEVMSIVISPREADNHSLTEQADEEDDEDNLDELIVIDDAEQEEREL